MTRLNKFLLIGLLVSILTFSLLAAIEWPKDFAISLLASVIGVVSTVFIAYVFLDRYRRERERKERAQRAEIQQDILGQMEEILIILVREYAETLNNYLEEPLTYMERNGEIGINSVAS